MDIEQFICMIFTPIGLLIGGIITSEENFLLNLENYLIKFRKKYNVEIDKSTYCRFRGMEIIKMATSLLILDVICFLSEVKNLKTILIILSIWGILSVIFCHINQKKFIKRLPRKIQG